MHSHIKTYLEERGYRFIDDGNTFQIAKGEEIWDKQLSMNIHIFDLATQIVWFELKLSKLSKQEGE